MNLNASSVQDAARPSEKWSSAENEETPLPLPKIEGLDLPGPLSMCTRNLRSRSEERPQIPEQTLVTDESSVKRRGRKRKNPLKKDDEFSRITNHLKYLLHRMKYEQNLIDAYSAEGWKGQSLEKLKPEKELQKAKSHILRFKLRVRDLLQRLDLSLTEGRFPQSLYDDKGQIYNEEIFCAKCRSKDLPDGNDIILCDGVCERGFHQFCLDPPLLKEHIPPGNELWLCPGCQCKVDCMHLVNDWHEAKLSFLDSWEKVFPEAASGKTLDGGSEFSEDDDFDPEIKEEVHGDGIINSKESNDLVVSSNLVAPSEDSEDDDDEYDPDAVDVDVEVEEEGLDSDFGSESDYLVDEFCENPALDEDLGKINADVVELDMGGSSVIPTLDEDSGKINSDVVELDMSGSNVIPTLGKRRAQRLDYDKLNNEMYGNVDTDSSDEDYEKTAGQKKRKNISKKISPILPKSPPMENGQNKSNDVEGKNNSTLGNSSEAGSSVKRTGRRYKILPEETTQRLVESFTENNYPKRVQKENLATELGITIQQVDRWFNNARWSSRHSDVTAGSSREQISNVQVDEKSCDVEQRND